MKRIGDYVETYTGIKFYPLDPRPNDICIEDIAQSLSLQCRFNGHCDQFYSVAEHSVRCLWEYKKRCDVNNASPQAFMRMLMHDSGESFLCDIPRPLKPYLKGYIQAEDKLLQMIYEKYNVGEVPEMNAPLFDIERSHDELLQEIDLVLLATEARDLGMNFQEWGLPFDPLKEQIIPWTSRFAKDNFLKHFKELREQLS